HRVPQNHWTRSTISCIVDVMIIGGHTVTSEMLAWVQDAATQEGMSRQRLSRIVCQQLNWRHRDGRLKGMSCRKALLTLHRQGKLVLPLARPTDFTEKVPLEGFSQSPISCSLKDLGPLELILVNGDKSLSRLWRTMMRSHHPLKDGPLCGAQLRYLVRSSKGWLGGLSFSAPAWKLKERDEWIGWASQDREQGLSKIVCNSRFLILPMINVPHLASQTLGLALRQLRSDWFSHYKVHPALVETFVDQSRWKGTCYRAANFIDLGLTQGRGRQDSRNEAKLSRKQILVYELTSDWRTELCSSSNKILSSPSADEAVTDWADGEFGNSSLGDARLTDRLKLLGRDFFANPTASLPQACGSRAKTKAAYRFFDNKATNLEDILQSHYLATEERSQNKTVILAVQDTTTINYTTPQIREGLGPIEYRKDGAQGLILHSTLAFDVDGVPLGFVDAQCWARNPEEFGKEHRKKREKQPIENKESFKWLRSYRAVSEIQKRNPNTLFVSVGDRESDIYELFSEANHTADGAKLLVRAQHNRQLKDEELRLWETLQNQPLAGKHLVEIPRSDNKPARQAELEIRFSKITLCVPRDKKKAAGGKDLPEVQIWAILAEEKNSKVSKPIQWLLLTTLPIENIDQAVEKINWYSKRWGIEVFHRTIKTGCRIEDRQLWTADRLEACLAIDMVVAWRIHHMTHLARQAPDASCELVFEENEWYSLVAFTQKKTPVDPPTLREAVRMVAGLGGFLGRKSDAEPGTQTIWRGVEKLSSYSAAFALLRENPSLLDVPQKRVSRRSRFG
ncbi:MAG: IS4 family transposase, partial [Candidatus Obscuribacterales bacterium]|nr:IS4 family transposase [Candidatus Obscuribacterales bacterium]